MTGFISTADFSSATCGQTNKLFNYRILYQFIILLFLGNNFRTRNDRKLIKGSKDLDSSLVSNKNLIQKIPSSSWGPGPNSLSQNGQKPTLLMTSPTKK